MNFKPPAWFSCLLLLVMFAAIGKTVVQEQIDFMAAHPEIKDVGAPPNFLFYIPAIIIFAGVIGYSSSWVAA